MRIVFLTSGASGAGRFAVGCSLGTALRRAGIACDYTMVAAHEFGHLGTALGLRTISVPFDQATVLDPATVRTTQLYRTLVEIKPDIIVVQQAWYMLHHILQDFACPKVAMFFQASGRFFCVPHPAGDLVFDPSAYNLVLGIEPWNWSIPCTVIEPLVLRNHDEIRAREDAAAILKVDPSRPVALVATNGMRGEFETLQADFSYLEDEYQVVYSSNYDGGVYPVVDYFNLFDFIVCAGGYNSFWEVAYFGKEAHFVAQPRRFEDQQWRIDNGRDFRFMQNGADRLVELLSAIR